MYGVGPKHTTFDFASETSGPHGVAIVARRSTFPAFCSCKFHLTGRCDVADYAAIAGERSHHVGLIAWGMYRRRRAYDVFVHM